MKILFICSSIDSELLNIVDTLKESDLEVDILDIISYEFLYHNGKKIYIRPKSKYKALEYFFILDEVNEYHRRREIFDYLNRYDAVHIYKSGFFAKDFKDKIEAISLRYIMTPNDTMLKSSLKLDKLFEDSNGFLFFDEFIRNKYRKLYGYEFINIVLQPPIKALKSCDEIEREVFEEFLDYLQVDLNKLNVFCMFSGSKIKQKDLLIKLVNLPIEIKQKTTFVLYFKDEDDDFSKRMLLFLKDMKLDYIVLGKSVQKNQLLMAIKACKASIFIEHSIDNELLMVSLYAKKHIFLFEPKELDEIFRRHKIFMDDFKQFYFLFKEDEINRSLYKEIFDRNYSEIMNLFHPESFCDKYLKFLVEHK